MDKFEILWKNLAEFTWQNGVMILIGCLLIFLAIKKEMEPTLLLPMGFG
ncbi:MAG: sodium ion-translocating decarboxylase subunit beta, partial [Clostridia bacterium]|nr:sodium ion-translocating decarboxylase subunit beta [Clostridia bacterium]